VPHAVIAAVVVLVAPGTARSGPISDRVVLVAAHRAAGVALVQAVTVTFLLSAD
jgi:hypothetical protein